MIIMNCTSLAILIFISVFHVIWASDGTVEQLFKSCDGNDDCDVNDFCHELHCYPFRKYNESCQILAQCPPSVQCINDFCLCSEGYEHDNTGCKETTEHIKKRKQEDEEARKRKHDKRMHVWRIIGITGGVLLLVAVLIIRHRIRKNKIRMNIQERRKSVLDQARSPSISLPMSQIGPKRKFSTHYAERF